MYFVPFDIDGTEGTCRTQVLACAATDATLYADSRNFQSIGTVGIKGHHADAPRGTMVGAVIALLPVAEDDAILLNPLRTAYLQGGFVCHIQPLYSSRGAYFGAFCTFRAAITPFVGHFRLHQCCKVAGRT